MRNRQPSFPPSPKTARKKKLLKHTNFAADASLLAKDMKDGIERIYQEQRPRLIGWMSSKIGREEAEDALHDVIVRSLVNLDSLEGVRDLTAWLWKAAARSVIDVWRKRKRRKGLISEDGSDWIIDGVVDAKSLHGDTPYEREENLAALARAISELPTEQREVIVAQSLNGETFKSISERTGISVDTLAGRKRYAIEHLRAALSDRNPDFRANGRARKKTTVRPRRKRNE